jgi:phage terminase Nu1 subunit (DNA packaging protein)
MPELIGLREYARRRGVSLGAVQKAVKSGRIVLLDGKIDPEVADIQWARNTNPAQQRGSAAVASMASTTAIAPRASRGPAGDSSDDGAGPQLLESRARREQALAELAELELAEKRGELVPVADIRKALVPKILGVRDALDTLADRLAPLLAAESDPAKVYALLKAEHRQILAQLTTESRAPAEVQ